MNPIYASKLYRASKRKDKINAALVNSANAGLIQQLSEDLDKEYQQMNIQNQKAKEAKNDAENAQAQGAEETHENGVPKSLSSGLSGGSFNPATDLVSYPEGEEGEMPEGEEGEMPEGEATPDEEAPADTEIEEATQVDVNEVTDPNESILSQIEENEETLKEGLNSNKSTAGVSRISLKAKDNEEWIYYNDDVNLNNVMIDVIDYVSKICKELEFNRLARSDNAIVFEIVY